MVIVYDANVVSRCLSFCLVFSVQHPMSIHRHTRSMYILYTRQEVVCRSIYVQCTMHAGMLLSTSYYFCCVQ
jgi:hypothetical protein